MSMYDLVVVLRSIDICFTANLFGLYMDGWWWILRWTCSNLRARGPSLDCDATISIARTSLSTWFLCHFVSVHWIPLDHHKLHTKNNQQQQQRRLNNKILYNDAPINISNVQVSCSSCMTGKYTYTLLATAMCWKHHVTDNNYY
jgi:hypothetical protein